MAERRWAGLEARFRGRAGGDGADWLRGSGRGLRGVATATAPFCCIFMSGRGRVALICIIHKLMNNNDVLIATRREMGEEATPLAPPRPRPLIKTPKGQMRTPKFEGEGPQKGGGAKFWGSQKRGGVKIWGSQKRGGRIGGTQKRGGRAPKFEGGGPKKGGGGAGGTP